MAVGLLSHSDPVLEGLVVLALWVLRVVDSSHTVGMSFLYQSSHSFLLIA